MARTARYRVLVADDDRGCRESLVSLLTVDGFRAFSVGTGSRAVELLRQRVRRRWIQAELEQRNGSETQEDTTDRTGRDGPDETVAPDDAGDVETHLEKEAAVGFDFLVIDYDLPGLTGLDVLRALKAEPQFFLPSIIVTGDYSRDLERAALALGSFAVVPKPLDPTGFRSMVKHLIAKHLGGR